MVRCEVAARHSRTAYFGASAGEPDDGWPHVCPRILGVWRFDAVGMCAIRRPHATPNLFLSHLITAPGPSTRRGDHHEGAPRRATEIPSAEEEEESRARRARQRNPILVRRRCRALAASSSDGLSPGDWRPAQSLAYRACKYSSPRSALVLQGGRETGPPTPAHAHTPSASLHLACWSWQRQGPWRGRSNAEQGLVKDGEGAASSPRYVLPAIHIPTRRIWPSLQPWPLPLTYCFLYVSLPDVLPCVVRACLLPLTCLVDSPYPKWPPVAVVPGMLHETPTRP